MTLATKPKMDMETLSLHFAADLLHRALLGAGSALKASEVARLVGRSDVDLRLTRVVLAKTPDRFTMSDRKWAAWSRYSDPSRTVERTLEELIKGCGMPVSAAVLAAELAAIYGRPAEVYEEMLPRLLCNRDRYFDAGDKRWGLASWLLDTSSGVADDVQFDNYLESLDLSVYTAAAEGLDPSDTGTVAAFLDRVDEPVPSKALQYVLWAAKPSRYDPGAVYARLLADPRLVCLSTQEWIGPALGGRLSAQFAKVAEIEVEESSETHQEEAAQPLVISDEEREQLVEFVLRSEAVTRVPRMLEDIFEVSEGEPTYEADTASIEGCLRTDPRVVWVGTDRFVPVGAIPDYVFSVPDLLRFSEQLYLDPEGNDLDVLLEDDGLSGGLDKEIQNAMAQDVCDEEFVPEPEATPPVTVRCVLKFHHKEIGTLPLCQMPPGFFPIDAPISQVEFVLPNGHRADVWVNSNTRMLYGLLDWYNTIPVDSGAVFYLERQAPDRYILTCGEETEPSMFISRNRVNELMDLGRRAEAEDLPTFEVLREIMEHYRKGIEYITALTELNIARRTTRRMTASLLAGYHCFFQRGKAWVYDARKLSQGFDKSKRKYMVKK